MACSEHPEAIKMPLAQEPGPQYDFMWFSLSELREDHKIKFLGIY